MTIQHVFIRQFSWFQGCLSKISWLWEEKALHQLVQCVLPPLTDSMFMWSTWYSASIERSTFSNKRRSKIASRLSLTLSLRLILSQIVLSLAFFSGFRREDLLNLHLHIDEVRLTAGSYIVTQSDRRGAKSSRDTISTVETVTLHTSHGTWPDPYLTLAFFIYSSYLFMQACP